MIHQEADLSSEEMIFESEHHDLSYNYKETSFELTPSLTKVRNGHEHLIYDEITQ